MSWTKFEQHESLATRLANVLREYPAGPGLFKEFVQNADDAGARHFAIIVDAASHEVSTAPEFDALAEAMHGPSLLVYNDAVFTESDFASISSVGSSGKAKDSGSIGKYGLVREEALRCAAAAAGAAAAAAAACTSPNHPPAHPPPRPRGSTWRA